MDAKELVPLLAQSALFLIVASFGLRAHARDVVAAMRNTGLVVRGILAVNVAVPIAAIIACSLLPIDPAVRLGIVIMAVSPLAPLIPGKMLKGGLDASTAVGLYVALIVSAVVFVPATVALLSALYPANASISVAAVGRLVALSILLPIGVGLAIGTAAPAFARRWAPIVGIVGFIAIAILVLLILIKQGGAIVGLIGDGSVLAIALTVVAGLAAGHWLGRPDPANSNALANAAAIRHPGIAALIVHANYTDPRVMLAVVLFLLTSVIVAALYQKLVKRRAGPSADGAVAT